MISFDIGVSALQAAQVAMDTIGQNLASSNTPGYHRQVADLTSNMPTNLDGVLIGTGVNVADIQQLKSSLVESALTTNTSDTADTQAQLDTLNQVQASFGTVDQSLQTAMDAFFNNVQQLAAQPEDTALRQTVIGSATTLTGNFNSLASALNSVQANLDSEASATVNEINAQAQQIAQLNSEISAATVRGVNPNDLLDQRGQLINDLAGEVGVQVVPQAFGEVNVIAAGAPVVVGSQAVALQFSSSPITNASVTLAGSTTPLPVRGGKLGGLLAVRNQALPAYQAQLNHLAGQLIAQVDEVQATGIGLSGPSTFLSSQRRVSNINVPLARAGLAFPPTPGTLYVSVTNQATGANTLTAVNIDPSTQSLQDVANALSAVPNIQAVTDAQTGTLQVLAKPGFAFDFAGQVSTSVSTAGITGTTQPQLGGSFTGPSNDVYTYQVVGSGTVGVTPGLALQVTNSTGGAVATLNIGQGYSPGSNLTVANGITAQLGAGTANSGDSFSSPVIARPDTGGVLTALGLGTFFTGSTANDIAVQPALQDDPTLLAGSRTGQPGDTSNLDRLVALRDQPTLAGGTQTFDQAYGVLVGGIGTQVSNLGTQQSAQTALGQQLEGQQQSISGVDPNEELTNLLSFQQAFQLASRYISVVNDTMQSLLQITT